MQLIDLDQKVFVTICDETKDGMLYEIQLSIGELLAKSLSDFTPQVVDAIPVGWLIDRANDPERAPLYRRYAQMLYEEWQHEQEAQDG